MLNKTYNFLNKKNIMEGEKKVKINGVNIKCLGYYDYGGNYYVTIFNDDTGEYIDEIFKCRIDDSDFMLKLENLLKNRMIIAS